ncbi:phosphoribosylanthranilate isomerase [Hirschia baltica]|uniref:N-(5'-phosphoribosyl)anthranilate isomerase n=1 Tax=Hirschia baltica (strain ATCC 49814 / DSM 5838 / IFAM 1418) TaxID=582402 RepID=C6XMW3_HIRBI|nr:phosphoribosylanthranilate isomerase [Hirschia baltica]ACT60027.1 Phosphoribosylanthranilate isomerase [Hirschia baltica ATCC 49814]
MKNVKICGLQDMAMIDVAINAGAEHLGFVHFQKSPRHLELQAIENLTNYVGDKCMTWVVLAKPSIEVLRDISQHVPSVGGLQIHGDITDEMMHLVKAIRPDMNFMRAYSVADQSDFPSDQEMRKYDFVLFDAKPSPEDKLPGGNGTRFNWQIMQDFDVPVPWFLAGGLNAGNVKDAIFQSGAHMVDVSSGVEISPGQKDANLIRSFISAVITT